MKRFTVVIEINEVTIKETSDYDRRRGVVPPDLGREQVSNVVRVVTRGATVLGAIAKTLAYLQVEERVERDAQPTRSEDGS